jgi:hypothetical protein
MENTGYVTIPGFASAEMTEERYDHWFGLSKIAERGMFQSDARE